MRRARTLRPIWIVSLVGVLLVTMAIGVRYHLDLTAAEERLTGRSRVIDTPQGRLEYAEQGTGRPLLMIHGTGGGFDQGLLFSGDLHERGFRVIAPSRFGYLRSAPDPVAPELQADAFAMLLDELGVQDAVVVGGSAGANFAAAFALRHPERCRALVLLVPASNLNDRDPVEMTEWEKALVARLAGSDFLYWALLRVAPDQVIKTLLATDPTLVGGAARERRERVSDIAEGMLPISRRTEGMLADGRLAGSPTEIDYSSIRVPTLIISAKDDLFGTAGTGRRFPRDCPIFPKRRTVELALAIAQSVGVKLVHRGHAHQAHCAFDFLLEDGQRTLDAGLTGCGEGVEI
jgi:2-hydroxy-6-oxonona-2,4-dienedioate hydrolase